MSRDDLAWVLLTVLAALAVAVTMLVCPQECGADARPVPADECGPDTRADMVRLRVAELGRRVTRQRRLETAAIWWVLVRRRAAARRYHDPEATYRQVLHWYAGGRLQRPTHARARRIAAIDPSTLPRVQEHARAWCAGEVRDPCPRCHQWGMPDAGSVDMRRAHRAGWRRAGIGRVLAFWFPGGSS